MKNGLWRSGVQRCSALASAGLLAVAGCATPGSPVLTPVADAPTGTYRPGSFVWHDLLTPDVDAARTFYGALFGWTFAQHGRYVEIRNGGRKIGGIVQVEPGDGARTPAIWLPSLSVPDVDEAAEICARGKFRNMGQVCISASRFFVQESVADRFIRRFVERR